MTPHDDQRSRRRETISSARKKRQSVSAIADRQTSVVDRTKSDHKVSIGDKAPSSGGASNSSGAGSIITPQTATTIHHLRNRVRNLESKN